MDVIGTNPTLKQNIELPISKIFKNNSQIATMEHQELIKYLEDSDRQVTKPHRVSQP